MTPEAMFRALRIEVIREGHHHVHHGWLQMHCPYCRISNYHLGYNIAGNYFSCWKCGRRSLNQTLAMLSGASYSEVKKYTGDLDDTIVSDFKKAGIFKPPKTIPLSDKYAGAHRRYIKDRGLEWEYLAEVWGVQAITSHKTYGWRLYMPITYNGEAVSFTTRSLTDDGLRYLSASPSEEKYPHKDIMFGADHCRFSMLVVEGPFDVYKIGPGASATLGTGYRRKQLAMISRFHKRGICFDDEPLAQEKAIDLCRQLMTFDGETYNFQIGSKDPGSADEQTISELRDFIQA